MRKPCALAIAGFDPSAGAGILADIKTVESLGVYGLGVCSALTYQNDISFISVDWIKKQDIIKQVAVLDQRFSYSVVKIGLMHDWETLGAIVDYLVSVNNNVKIIVDPILKASAGFEFHKTEGLKKITDMLKKIYLLTPNLEEAIALGDQQDGLKNAEQLSRFCNVLFKGGHSTSGQAADILFTEGKQYSFEEKKIKGAEKHGSGCVLSSAIAAGLALDMTLVEACTKAKSYITDFLKSEKGLIGYHPLQHE